MTDRGENVRPAVGVCGFPRSGSTMLMTMLDSGGLRPVEGSHPGSYELDALDLDDLRGRPLAGHAVKLLDWALRSDLPREQPWKFIWLDRSAQEQAKSQVKFMSTLVPELPLHADSVGTLARSFKQDLPDMLRALGRYGPTLMVEFEKILADPYGEAKQIAGYLLPEFDLDPAAMSAVVLERDGRCRPDLSIELGLMQ